MHFIICNKIYNEMPLSAALNDPKMGHQCVMPGWTPNPGWANEPREESIIIIIIIQECMQEIRSSLCESVKYIDVVLKV